MGPLETVTLVWAGALLVLGVRNGLGQVPRYPANARAVGHGLGRPGSVHQLRGAGGGHPTEHTVRHTGHARPRDVRHGEGGGQ